MSRARVGWILPVSIVIGGCSPGAISAIADRLRSSVARCAGVRSGVGSDGLEGAAMAQ